uniref:Gamma carbonic anhydrase n=1 Tax=Phaeomonas parva TaxID=124430 RepID=A0A7S1U829_9STRA|mmetsp:Transcript_32751/g.103698  ORF Transcript_32751/g.103698 Transcript_32751/m.103698 type:complete len:227 (+) Transcript_32751:223-903(+)
MARFINTIGRALRETGQAMDRLGLAAMDVENTFLVPLNRHRQLMNLEGKVPSLSGDVWVAPSASAIGDVAVSAGASVWYGTVLRGDAAPIVVGPGSNIQDLTSITTSEGAGVTIGSKVTVGHKAMLHGCSIGDGTLVGMGAQVYNSTVEGGAMVAAGAVVKDAAVGAGQLWAGNPATHVRDLTPDEVQAMVKQAEAYATLSGKHRTEFADVADLMDSEGAQAKGSY